MVDSGDPERAKTIAIEGAKLNPTNWRLQRWLARLRQVGNENINAVRGHYEAAIRYHKGDVALMVEHAAYLFRKLFLPEANIAFSEVKALSISTQERRIMREHWKNDDGTPRIFTGRVERYSGARGTVLSVPENFRASFWRTDGPAAPAENETVRFSVGFSAQGVEAKLMKVRIAERLVQR